MFSIVAYACASFYFIFSNFSAATLLALNLAKSVPVVESSPLLIQVEKNVKDVILVSSAKRAAASGVLSLLVYPLAICINEIVQFFMYWLALFAFAYLSLSQSPEAHKKLYEYCAQAFQMLKAAAPESFQNMLALRTETTLVEEKKQ